MTQNMHQTLHTGYAPVRASSRAGFWSASIWCKQYTQFPHIFFNRHPESTPLYFGSIQICTYFPKVSPVQTKSRSMQKLRGSAITQVMKKMSNTTMN